MLDFSTTIARYPVGQAVRRVYRLNVTFRKSWPSGKL